MMKKQYVIFIAFISIMGLDGMKRSGSSLPSPAEKRMRAREDARIKVQLETPRTRTRRLLFSGLDSGVEEQLWDTRDAQGVKQEFMNSLTPDQVFVINSFARAFIRHRVPLSQSQKEIFDRFPDFVKEVLLEYQRDYPIEILEEISATEVEESEVEESEGSDGGLLLPTKSRSKRSN